MRFTAELLLAGKTATGFQVPNEVVDSLAAGKRPAVRVSIGQHTYRSTIAVMGGAYMLPVSAEHRAAAGISAGDLVDVEVQLDTEKREVSVPPDLADALAAVPVARAAFDKLSYSNQSRHVLSVEGAKTADTRQRRVGKVLDALRESAP